MHRPKSFTGLFTGFSVNKAIVVSLVACLAGGPIVTAVTSTPAMAQASQSGVLSQTEAVKFANKLGMTLPEAVKAGYLSPAEAPGTYVITERGAGAVGVPVLGPLNPMQITALVAGAIGLTFVIVDFLDDEGDGDGGAGPTPTPTPVVTPTPSPTPTGGTETSTSTSTLPPIPTPTPIPTLPPINGGTNSQGTSGTSATK